VLHLLPQAFPFWKQNRGADGRASKHSLLVRPSVSGPVPCSGAPGATGQGAGRSQRRDSRRRQSPGTKSSPTPNRVAAMR
jgi:hypothetical protein